ncbi:nucleolar protein 14 homolog [Harpegnathos saltator]|uniref:nucleolar protein 14 homolog n=1 Tax=Harpegnathos saltator TaxID=610380 RepID=UPI00058E3379|nr:nucleolar protein 14 homolog [Harpegnathos saltator]XP_011152079.1 nucleolar protein 14 homolog [Harpegnathos saltator]XP_025162133.1 nucleolar protein 14 homolog [Harpegnathos saltator]
MVKTMKRNLSEFAQRKRVQKDKKHLNPFEVHINREKQKILGRKNKNDRGLPGISKTKAIKRRKQSLLQEYKMDNKDNVFLDKRIGEKNSAMSTEDKAMARFAMELKKEHKKKNIYNLNDDGVLTHRGQTLEEIEKFDDPGSDDEFSDEDTSGRLDKNFVEGAHFGGGVLSKPDSALSRKDLIDQLIAESKKRKAEKQKIREQTIDLTEKLDSEWRDLLPLVSTSKKPDEDADKTARADTYDITVQELKFEARGNPSEKLKSEEEIIQEEKEKLEKLEANRLARMKGFVSNANNECKHRSADDLDDDFLVETIVENADDDDDHNSMANGSNNADSEEGTDADNDKNDNDAIGKDDNNVNYYKHGEISLQSTANEETKRNTKTKENGNREQDKTCSELSNVEGKPDIELNNENVTNKDLNSKDSTDSTDNFSDMKEFESSSEGEIEVIGKHVTFLNDFTTNTKETKQSNLISSESILKQYEVTMCTPTSLSDENKQQIRNDLLKRKEIMEKARRELPYTYNAPVDFEELEKLLEGHCPEYQSIIVDRIIKCNHWTVDNKNKEKLSNLFVYLLQYIHNCASMDDPDNLSKCFQVFDRLCPYIYDLAHMNPENAKICVQEIIKEKHNEFEANRRKYPDMSTIIFFKLVSLLFPTSDFRHPVVTPCLVFMSQILLQCRIKNRSDIARGLFICTLILEYTTLSKRFAPSAINFLRGIVYTATPETSKTKIIPPFKRACNLLQVNEELTDIEIEPTGAHMTAHDLMHEELNNEFRLRALLTTVNLIRDFKNQLQELEAVYLIFEPIFKLLKVNKFMEYPRNIRKHIKELCKEIKILQNKKLKHMVVEKKRPKPLRLYEPKIIAVYDGKQRKPMSKEKAEREKLLHNYKKEMKGAIREIRRDNAFLAKIQISQQIKNDVERKRKVKAIFGEAAIQQNELKKIKRKH